jgi:Chlorophyll A-B binding protein
MKVAASLLVLSTTASAFTSPVSKSSMTSIKMSEPVETETPVVIPETPVQPSMSAALPFMPRPLALDGSLVGDVGFDPLGFAKSKEDLMNYREAEIKHGRLAMLVSSLKECVQENIVFESS